MMSRQRGTSSPVSRAAAAAYERLEARVLLAYVNVNTESPAQTIHGIGGNYAAGRYGAGSVNDNVGIYTLNNLSPKHARIGIPLLDWEATNDNSDPNSFNWSGFKQTGGSLNVLQLMSDLKTRGIPISAAVWDAPNWMITSATQGSTNFRVVEPSKYPEFVESIAAYLVKARDTYGVTVDSVSINESDGGYRLKFTSAEMINLIKIAGPRFQSLGLNPTWLVGDTTTPSALVNYATPILQDATARQYIGAISYHSWGAFNYADSVFQGIANLGAQYNLPVWCEEVGYDSQLYLTPSTFQTWTYATKLAQTYQKILKLSKATVADYWEYQNDYGLTSNSSPTNPTLYPAYFVVKQLADNLKPGAQMVSTTSDTPSIQAMGARDVTNERFFLQLINTSTQPQDVVLNGLPNATLTLLRSRSGENNITVGNYNPSNGTLTITVPADSVSALTGALAVPASWTAADIGSPSGTSSKFANSTYTIKANGGTLSGASDSLRFVSQDLDADGSIIARVDPGNGAGGLMIRESNAAGARMVALMLDSSGTASFVTRSSTGSSSASSGFNAASPYYLRLSRSGNTFTAAYSQNGSSFLNIAQIDIAMSGTARIGMAVISGTGSFTQVQVSANAPSAAPSNLVAAAAQENRVDLTWADNSGNEDGFKIERSPDGVNNWTQIGILATPNANSYSDSSVVANTQYFYRVRAYNGVGNGAYSNIANVRTPSGLYEAELTSPQSGVRVDTTWSGFTGTGFIDFVTASGAYIEFNVNAPTSGPYAMDIRYGLGTGNPLRPLSISIDGVQVLTNVSFPSAANWTTWMTYSLYANFSAGNHTVRLTDTGSDGPNIDNLRIRASAPSTPGSFLAKASSGKINLTWTDSQIETGYRIERSTNGINFTDVANLAANTITWQDPSAVTGTSYTYRIRAFNSVGDSNTAVSSASIPTIPNAPTSLTATGISTTQIDLAWTDNSSNEDVFRIEYSTNGSSFTTLANTASNVRTYSATGLTPGQQYWFRVFAINGGGNSAFSNTVNAFPVTAPAAPTNVTAITVSTTQINVTWANVANETGYIIESSPNGTSNWAQVGTTATDVLLFSHTNLTAGTTYFYRVKANSLNGPSAASSNASATTTPAAPTLSSVTAVSQTQIDLVWTNVAGETGYSIERSPNGSTSWSPAGTALADSTTFSDINLTPGTTYFYRVKATGAGGTSAASNMLSATTQSPLVQPAPTSLLATSGSMTQIDLSWTDTANETQYLVEQSLNGTSGWAQIGTSAANVAEFFVSDLAPGVTYFYRVKAFGANGTSVPSNVSSATTIPGSPTLQSATPISTSRIDLAWTAVIGATSYTIERSADGTDAWAEIGTATTTSYSNINLNPSATWFYQVRATGLGGTSLPSNAMSATTFATPQAAPTTLAATTASNSQINLSWADTADETSYTIERSANGTTGWTQIATTLADVTTYSNIGLASGTTYFYQVRALGPNGTSNASNTASATTISLAPPTLTATTASASQINLSWADVVGETSFAIERSPDGTNSWAQVGTTTANVVTFSNTSLAAATTYFYRVKSLNAGGTSTAGPTASATTTPAAPASLSATAASASQINLAWSDVAGETSFSIERSADGVNGWSQVGTTLANVVTFSNTGLTSGTKFYYRVKAIGAGGTSVASNIANATTTSTGLPAPTSAVATVLSATQIQLTWLDNATTETGYAVERSSDGTTYTPLITLGANITTYTNTVTAKKTYYYRVRAVQNTTFSAYATAAPVTTPGSGGTTISGTVFNDTNSNGTKETTEAALVRWIVYIDSNNNNTRDATEQSIATSSTGTFTFGSLGNGTYNVRVMLPSGYRYTIPSNGLRTTTISKKKSVGGVNFGSVPTTTGTVAGPAFEFDPLPIVDAGGEITSVRLIEVA